MKEEINLFKGTIEISIKLLIMKMSVRAVEEYYKEKLDSNHDLQILDDSKVHVTGDGCCEIWKGTGGPALL